MEKLEKLLMDYNLQHIDDLIVSPWSKQYCRTPFPLYWQKVYDIMEKIDRKLKVFEIGCGQGDVTTIFCYLGFHSVCSFEKVPQLAENAKRRIKNLFDRKDIIIQEEYPNPKYGLCDVLVLVNCAYKDLADSKQSYKELMMNYYSSAGEPKYFIMEAIDSSYTKEDDEFPEYIRLSRVDVEEMFPIAKIQSWPTYVYPQNLKSKTLYLIEKK